MISMDEMYDLNFAPASPLDAIVHGSCRPGRFEAELVPPQIVEQWVQAIRSRGIRRVVCLLPPSQLSLYERPLLEQITPLLSSVVNAPIEDFTVPSKAVLARALAALHDAEKANEPVVVHCSAGIGRTGIVLTAWLIQRHGLEVEEAAQMVIDHAEQHDARRYPWEAGSQDVLQFLSELQAESR